MSEAVHFFHAHGPECDPVCVLEKVAGSVTWEFVPNRCPPHRFQGGWINDEKGGVIFCASCGEVREMTPATIEAPAEERIEESADVHPPK